MLVGGAVGNRALAVAGSSGARLRQHQARLRFRPSRCAILPSLRSLTIAGVNSVAGSRSRQPRQEIARTSRGTAAGMRARHAQGFDQRR